MRVNVSGCVWVAFVCCCFACDCVLELVVCRVRFARVSCPWLRFGYRYRVRATNSSLPRPLAPKPPAAKLVDTHRAHPQISTADRTHARTGPDTQRAQAHNHTQNSSTRTQPDTPHVHTHTHTHTPPATPPQPPQRASAPARQGNHRLRDLHRPLRERLRPLPPLLLHLPLPPHLVKLEAGEARE